MINHPKITFSGLLISLIDSSLQIINLIQPLILLKHGIDSNKHSHKQLILTPIIIVELD